jgi:drug/metabolite transporter (DMT)-like permease
MSLPILLAFGAMVGWGIGDFLIQRIVKKIGAAETLFWTTVFSSIILIPFVWRDLQLLTMASLPGLFILGIIGFLSGVIHFKALKIGKLAVLETILSIELPLTIILGLIFFKESLSLLQVGLIALLFIGIILISISFEKVHNRDWLEKGAVLALIAGLLVALYNFVSASQARALSPLIAIYVPWLVCCLICWLYIRQKREKNLIQNFKLNWRLILIMVIIDLLAWLAYTFAVAKEELAITISITESYVVIALILGVIINKEKIKVVQYIGALLAIGSSLLIGLVK